MSNACISHQNQSWYPYGSASDRAQKPSTAVSNYIDQFIDFRRNMLSIFYLLPYYSMKVYSKDLPADTKKKQKFLPIGFFYFPTTYLIGVVKTVIHESCDQGCLSNCKQKNTYQMRDQCRTIWSHQNANIQLLPRMKLIFQVVKSLGVPNH